MDTLGNLIDKQLTVSLKIEHARDTSKLQNLRSQLKSLSMEIDNISADILSGSMNPEDSIRPQHKTY